jgi:hypothetical protein
VTPDEAVKRIESATKPMTHKEVVAIIAAVYTHAYGKGHDDGRHEAECEICG